jgi:hypothetical protein
MRTAIFVLVALTACGAGQKDVSVRGKDSDLVALAGDWEGEYHGIESGRSGKVRFSLQLGRHVAEGQVFMGNETPLKIEFIEVEDGRLKGTIAPYTDPNCNCEVETSFLGRRIDPDTVSGEFETKVQGQTQTGTWRVNRTP